MPTSVPSDSGIASGSGLSGSWQLEHLPECALGYSLYLDSRVFEGHGQQQGALLEIEINPDRVEEAASMALYANSRLAGDSYAEASLGLGA